MADLINPFEHHHPHHHHDDDEDLIEALDPAQQSLNDALRVSFGLLKLAMIIVTIAYLFSGVVNIRSDEVAVRLHFGKVVKNPNDPESSLLADGFHITWPFPIEQIVRVSTKEQVLQLDESYWFEQRSNEAGQTLDDLARAAGMRARSLNPEKDGSMLTGDTNIVHARWEAAYTISDPVNYIEHVGDLSLADSLVQNAVHQGVVDAVAKVAADEFIRRPRIAGETATLRAQQVLDELQSGLKITKIIATSQTAPLSARQAYQNVTGALSEKETAIQKANKQRDEILGAGGGEAWRPLWEMVQDYEQAHQRGDPQALKTIKDELHQTFMQLRTSEKRGNRPVGGEAAKIVNEAKTYRTQLVKQIETERNEFEQLVDQYEQNPKLYTTRALARMWSDILNSGLIEVYYLPDNAQMRTKITRDPRMKKKVENARQRTQQEQQQP